MEIKIEISSGYSNPYLNIGWRKASKEVFETKFEFKTAKKLASFINNGDYINNLYIDKLYESNKQVYKLIKINKFNHTSIMVTVKKLSKREANLEILLS